MTSTPEQRAAFPLWAKLLVGLFIAFAVLFIAGSALFINWAGKFKQQATDPKQIQTSVVPALGTFAALPTDFQYVAGTALGQFAFLSVRHNGDATIVNLTTIPNPNKQEAKVILDRQISSETAKGDFTVNSTGTEPVGNTLMQYAVGYSKLPGTGGTMQRLTGVIVPGENPSHSVLVTGMTPGDKYNMTATKEFLSTIKSFK